MATKVFHGHYHAANCMNHSDQKLVTLDSIDEIHELQSRKPGFTKPEPDAIVMHVRLGDIVERSGASPLQMLPVETGANAGHEAKNFKMALQSEAELLENFRTAGFDKVRIVGGSHMPQFYLKSRVYAGCIGKAIQAAGYDVTIQLEGVPAAQDFYYSTHAKYLVVSAGGYSNPVGVMDRHGNGTIVGINNGLYW